MGLARARAVLAITYDGRPLLREHRTVRWFGVRADAWALTVAHPGDARLAAAT